MPIGLPVRYFFRRSRDGHYERDAQTAITVPKHADLLITTTPLSLQGLLTAQAQSPPSLAWAGDVDAVQAVGDDFHWIDELFQPADTGSCAPTSQLVAGELAAERGYGLGLSGDEG